MSLGRLGGVLGALFDDLGNHYKLLKKHEIANPWFAQCFQ